MTTDKNYFEDVKPPKHKRSIRDIPVPSRKRGSIPSRNLDDSKRATGNSVQELKPLNTRGQNDGFEIDDEILKELRSEDRQGKKSSRFFVYTIIFLFVLLGFFGIASLFHSASIQIEPKTIEASINKTVSIVDITNQINQNTLGYRIISVSKEVSKQVLAQKEEFVQSKAFGTITIVNEYSDRPQTLIKNTRFESPNGLIYRIQESANVPGYTMVNGQKVAGTLDVEVFADVADEKHNLNSAQFTIPGFKGQEPYELFYAKTKTPITGGFNGVRKVVSEEDLASTSIALEEELKNALILDLNNQISKEFVAIFEDENFELGTIEQRNSTDENGVTLTLSGNMAAKVFNKMTLSNEIASGTIIGYGEGQSILIDKIENANIQISNLESGERVLTINERLKFSWQVDTEKFKESIAGKTKRDFGESVSNFPEISKGELKISPPWRNGFPKDIKKIDVKINQI